MGFSIAKDRRNFLAVNSNCAIVTGGNLMLFGEYQIFPKAEDSQHLPAM
jgi:hypothetical protein